jgi:hypothetical protein
MTNFKTNVGSNNTYIKIKKTAAPYGLSYKNASTNGEEKVINNFSVSGFAGYKIQTENLKKPSIQFAWQNEDETEKQFLQFAIDEETAEMIESWDNGDEDALRNSLTPSPFNQLVTFLYLANFCPTAELYLSLKHDGSFFQSKPGASPNFKIWAEYKIGKTIIAKLGDILHNNGEIKKELAPLMVLAAQVKNAYDIALQG